MKCQNFSVLAAGIAIWAFIQCSPNSPDDNQAGNSTQVGNPAVVGMIVDENGNPVKGATVRLVHVSFTPSYPTAKSLAKNRGLTAAQLRAALLAATDSTITDSNGQYSFDTVDTGTYNVLADSGSTMAYQDSVAVEPDTQTTVPTDTLKAPGSLRGVIRLQPGHDSRKVFLIALGTFAVTSPADSIGNFSMANMAEGTYSVRILSTLDDYGVLDTSFAVTAGVERVLADTIALPYTGIPVPMGLFIDYDTLKQIVTLTWNVPTTGRAVKGYNVYRKHADSTSFVKIAGVVADTTYTDSTAVQDQTYEYKVAAVDTAETEGTKSEGVNVDIVGAFQAVLEFAAQPGLSRLTVKTNPSRRIYCHDGNAVFVYDSAGVYVGQLSSQVRGKDIDADASDKLYRVHWGDTLVQRWNADDSLTDEWTFPELYDIPYSYSPRLCLTHYGSNFLYIYDDKQVMTYAIEGGFLGKLLLSSNQSFLGAIAPDSLVVVDSLSRMLQIYDENWIKYHEVAFSVVSSERRITRGEVFNDSTLIVTISEYTAGWWNGTYLAIINVHTGQLLSILGKQYMRYENMGLWDYAVGPDKRVYVLIGTRTIVVFERRE